MRGFGKMAMPILPFFTVHRMTDACIPKCKGCVTKCPSYLAIPDDGSVQVEGECFQCHKCIQVCPRQHIHCGVKNIKGNEWWFVWIRVLLLVVLMWLL